MGNIKINWCENLFLRMPESPMVPGRVQWAGTAISINKENSSPGVHPPRPSVSVHAGRIHPSGTSSVDESGSLRVDE